MPRGAGQRDGQGCMVDKHSENVPLVSVSLLFLKKIKNFRGKSGCYLLVATRGSLGYISKAHISPGLDGWVADVTDVGLRDRGNRTGAHRACGAAGGWGGGAAHRGGGSASAAGRASR